MRVENPLPRTKSPGLAQLRRFVDLNTAKMSSAGQFVTPKYVETRGDGLKAVPFKEFGFSAACLAAEVRFSKNCSST